SARIRKMKGAVACAAVAMAAVFYLGAEQGAPDAMVVGAIDAVGATEHYRLVSRKLNCDVTAGAPSDPGRRALVLGAGCHDGSGLGEARWWLDRSDGTVAFMAEKGRILAEFAVADGAAYETYARGRPIMTLLARD